MKKLIWISIIFFLQSLNATNYVLKIDGEKNSVSNHIIVESCPTNYIRNNGQCEQLLQEDISLSCLINTWTLDAENRQCIFNDILSKTSSCPSGYNEYNASQCSLDQNVSASSSCPSGYSGNPCQRTRTQSPTQSCPNGYPDRHSACRKSLGQANVCDTANGWTYDWDGDCYKSGVGWKAATCASGLLYNTYCYSTTDTQPYIDSCSSGWTLSNGTCYRTYTADYNYSCSSGWTLSGSRCLRTTYVNKIVDSCPNDYIDQGDGTCEQTLIEDANITCTTENFTYNESTDKCESLSII